MPTWERGRPARTIARHSLGHLRRRDGTVAGPCLSFELANAVHAGRMAACRQRCADAPPPPARNKVAGETPAFPGGASPLFTPPHGGSDLPACKGRLAVHSDWPMPYTPAGWVPAGNLALSLHRLQPEIRLRARRPRSRGAGRRRSPGGLRPPSCGRAGAGAASQGSPPAGRRTTGSPPPGSPPPGTRG